MDLVDYGRFVAALVAVIALIGLMSIAMRRWGPMLGTRTGLRPGNRRLSVVEVLPVDARRRLLLVRRDGTEHLLLLGHPGEAAVIERGITAPPAAGLTKAGSE